MKKALLILLSVSLLSAETKQERGKRIIDEVVEALGGHRFLNMKDRVESGRAYSFYREELSGLSIAKFYTQYLDPSSVTKPGALAVRERQAFGKDEYSAVLFNGSEGYQVTFRGARPVSESVFERYRLSTLSNIFYILRERLSEPGMIFEYQSTDVWMNQPVEIVDITDSENRVVTVYFHRSTKLPVRETFFRRDPKTRERIDEEVEFAKYRDVDGVQWPFTMLRKRNGEKVYEMYAESVEINQGLSDSLFVIPSGLKILDKPLE